MRECADSLFLLMFYESCNSVETIIEKNHFNNDIIVFTYFRYFVIPEFDTTNSYNSQQFYKINIINEHAMRIVIASVQLYGCIVYQLKFVVES